MWRNKRRWMGRAGSERQLLPGKLQLLRFRLRLQFVRYHYQTSAKRGDEMEVVVVLCGLLVAHYLYMMLRQNDDDWCLSSHRSATVFYVSATRLRIVSSKICKNPIIKATLSWISRRVLIEWPIGPAVIQAALCNSLGTTPHGSICSVEEMHDGIYCNYCWFGCGCFYIHKVWSWQ